MWGLILLLTALGAIVFAACVRRDKQNADKLDYKKYHQQVKATQLRYPEAIGFSGTTQCIDGKFVASESDQLWVHYPSGRKLEISEHYDPTNSN